MTRNGELPTAPVFLLKHMKIQNKHKKTFSKLFLQRKFCLVFTFIRDRTVATVVFVIIFADVGAGDHPQTL